jgi:hypothetical protein
MDLYDCLSCIAGLSMGLVFGIHFGRVLNAIILNWENSHVTVRVSSESIVFLVGGGGGGVLFHWLSGQYAPMIYLIACSLGIFIGYIWPVRPKYTLGTFIHVVRMSEALRNKVPDIRKRARLILMPFVKPKVVEQGEKISEKDLAKEMEEALDTLEGVEEDDLDRDSEGVNDG